MKHPDKKMAFSEAELRNALRSADRDLPWGQRGTTLKRIGLRSEASVFSKIGFLLPVAAAAGALLIFFNGAELSTRVLNPCEVKPAALQTPTLAKLKTPAITVQRTALTRPLPAGSLAKPTDTVTLTLTPLMTPVSPRPTGRT